ncbi:MAG: hypothetical protein IPP94_14975 [Ignavibacteria bacterium]|nr:hypothetical protein [Ignavibacteria bacterium]
MRWYIGYLLFLMLCLGQSVAAQTRPVDSTTFFPLGLWGIWIDWNNDAPRLGGYPDWSQEDQNFTDIHANYMVDHIPEHIENMLISHVAPLGYRINIARQPNVYPPRPDTCSLRFWCTDRATVPETLNDSTDARWDVWRAGADLRISSLLHLYGNNPSVVTFYAGHESDIYPWDIPEQGLNNLDELRPNRKIAYQYVCEQWNARCPYPTKKLYFVGGRAGGFDLSHFLDSVPTRMWCFEPGYQYRPYITPTFAIQQQELDSLTANLDYAREIFTFRPVEMWACLQAHSMRYPTPSELRAEAYLSLSRGAKGLNWFVYGSSVEGYLMPEYNGLVTPARNPNNSFDSHAMFDGIAALHLELASLTPTLRTLFVRDGLTSQQAT